MKLSVVIVNYNVKYFLEQCLHSVMKAMTRIQAEVFVVDNNSVDGSVEMVREKFPAVKVIANTDNKGFSAANNQAIRSASSEYILLLNPDTVVEEDTFDKIIRFMDEHADAGALGVKMINGSGKFLPESKRGLPTPAVAFFKIFGLSRLFPKSKTFGRYHLGYLDENEIHTVDVLAGAFMLLRKSALDKAGLLDEAFFMYGEDIDLSYRITKAGYKNYYFPETRIIHYKGESTKKSSVNYVFVFYNAMIIFAKKHFSKSNASLFTFFIRIAIYLRAGAAILIRIATRLFLPILDFAVLFAGLYFLKEYWGENTRVHYPAVFMQYFAPAYILVWITGVFFSGGYDIPIKLSKVIRGILTGTFLILIIYALLPENWRYSRALILLGAAWASIALIATRLIANFIARKTFELDSDSRKRLLIVGQEEESNRVLSLLKLTDTTHYFIGFVSPEKPLLSTSKQFPEFDKYYLGTAENLGEIVEVYNIDEIIFCGKDVSSNQIIHYMSSTAGREVEYKIAPPESLFIIGSSSVDDPGELYVVDINSINKTMNKRNKRFIDIVACMFLLVLSPFLILFQKNPGGYLANILSVMMGKKSFVGYTRQDNFMENLPKIRPGVLNPVDVLGKRQLDALTVNRLNSLYAKDYRVYSDLKILLRAWRNLGRR